MSNDFRFTLTVTVTNDNDESCKTFTLCEQFPMNVEPAADQIKARIKGVHIRFRESHPHSHTLPSFLPTEVVVRRNTLLYEAA